MQPVWFKLHSQRIAPYTIDDISVIVPSASGRYENRWKWFWPQYVKNTHPDIVKRTIIPCDPHEKLPVPMEHRLEIVPMHIVPKTLGALERVTTRLTFRLANDIMVARKGWHEILLTQFNASEKLQLIAEAQHGISHSDIWESITQNHPPFKEAYPKPPVSAVYPHGSRLFAQTSVWQAYYRPVISITSHNHDDVVFGQLVQNDGVDIVHFGGINAYLPHKGITNRDFSQEDVDKIEISRKVHQAASANPGFRKLA